MWLSLIEFSPVVLEEKILCVAFNDVAKLSFLINPEYLSKSVLILIQSLFFDKTYFTEGLTNIASRVVKGLNGNEDGENRVISLQTGFGGGKTHTLISLYHLAKAGKKVLILCLFKFLVALC